MNITRTFKFAVLALGVADLLVFANANPLTILYVGIGAAAMTVGLFYFYRPVAVVGLLLTMIGAASVIHLETLLEVSAMITAMVGILVPSFVLTCVALSAGNRAETQLHLVNRPTFISAAFSMICLWSVPIVAIGISLFTPGVSMRMSQITEMAIALMTAAVIGTVILFRTDVRPKAGPEVEK